MNMLNFKPIYMKTNDNFEFDLMVGQIGENVFAKLLESKTIEVKTDFIAWKTGNIYVEFECWGKRSGIATTKADFWVFLIMKKGTNKTDFDINDVQDIKFIKTEKLKTICREWLKNHDKIKGGRKSNAFGCLIKANQI